LKAEYQSGDATRTAKDELCMKYMVTYLDYLQATKICYNIPKRHVLNLPPNNAYI